MRSDSPSSSPQRGFFDIFDQLDPGEPLIALSQALDWVELETCFSSLYSKQGRSAKPIRLMCGLLILKQLYNLSDESVIKQWKMNPYFQFFCGETSFQIHPPCHSTELVKFRQRIGMQGAEKLFSLSVELHGKTAEEGMVMVDTTV